MPIPIQILTFFRVGQKIIYEGKPCIIESFPVPDMVCIRNLDYSPGDWSTAKVYTKELMTKPQSNQSADNCSCSSSTIFIKGCQCGGA